MAAVAPIEGTVSISLGAGIPGRVASFTVPVSLEDHGGGDVTLHAAPADAIKAAAAAALSRAADELLESIPTAIITAAHVATCGDCGTRMASNDPTLRIEHAEGGAHVASYTYGGVR